MHVSVKVDYSKSETLAGRVIVYSNLKCLITTNKFKERWKTCSAISHISFALFCIDLSPSIILFSMQSLMI